MKLIPSILGALALAFAGAAAAQTGSPVATPASITPGQAVCFGTIGQPATCVDATHPLPVTGGTGGGGGASNADSYLAAAALSSALNSTYVVSLNAGQGTAAFSVTGLTASGAVLSIEYSDDKGTTWSTIRTIGTAVAAGVSTVSTDGMFTVNASGHTQLRLRVSTGGTGNISVVSNTSLATKEVALSGLLPGFYTPPSVKLDPTSSTPAGEAVIGHATGVTLLPTAAPLTTPSGTTAYAIGNLIANSATAASVTPLTFANACRVQGGTGLITRLRLFSTDTAFAGYSVRVHLHQTAPTFANGDHAAWSTSSSGYLGAADLTFDRTFTDGVLGIGAPVVGAGLNFACAPGSTTIYGEMESRSTPTPTGAKQFTATLEVVAN